MIVTQFDLFNIDLHIDLQTTMIIQQVIIYIANCVNTTLDLHRGPGYLKTCHCRVYSDRCTLYGVRCTVYNVH